MTFEELYNNHKNLVFNLALQYVQNTEDAQEIAQDVFVVVHQTLASFRNEADPKTWIYRVTINKSLDFIKAKKRQKRFGFLTSLFYPDSNEIKYDQKGFDHPGIEIEQKESLELIFKHINNLPENQKTALILSKIEDKSQKEIADIMKLNVKAVESLIQRAKVSLAKNLEKNEGK